MKTALLSIMVVSCWQFFCPCPEVLSGSGTEADPWLIRSLADFDIFAAEPNYWDDYTRLESDIDLVGRIYTAAIISPDTNDANSEFGGIAFTGSFDGNDHSVINLTIDAADSNDNCLGLFGKIDVNSVVKKGQRGRRIEVFYICFNKQ